MLGKNFLSREPRELFPDYMKKTIENLFRISILVRLNICMDFNVLRSKDSGFGMRAGLKLEFHSEFRILTSGSLQ